VPYSQRDEEPRILEAVRACSNKRLLDIGAWDPVTFSNSRALIEQGWGGVLIEPSPTPVRNLARAYKDRADIDVLMGAVDPLEPRLMQMMITDDAVSAEAGSQQVKTWAEAGNYFGRLWVQCFTIDQILSRWGAFEFVNIDTEGTSVDVLKVLLATEMLPKCICFEHDGRYIEALQAARPRGYQSIYESTENVVLAR
jgi:FkbM family methyltransferase